MCTPARIAAALAASLVALPALAAKDAPKAPPLEGLWDAPGGRVELTRRGDKVKGVLTAPATNVPLAAGAVVLEGSFLDDNLTADVRVGLLSPSCGDHAEKAFAMLLLTKKGRLTGGVSAKAPCARELSSITFQRVKEEAPGAKAAPVMVGPAAGAGVYDPRGHRVAPVPDTVRGLMLDAQSHLEEGRFEQARKQFQRAIAKDPLVGEAYNGVGVTFYARNDFEAAIDWYKRGLDAAPGFGDLYYNLACAYSLLGKKGMALRYLKLAAVKGFTELEALDRDTDLDALRGEPAYAEIRELMAAPPPPVPAGE